jgi:F-type H+-transporting ATPase subunit epsilon
MESSYKLSVVAPDRLVAEVETTSVTAPGFNGYFGVLNNHQPIIAALRPGLLEYVPAGSPHERHYIAVGGGFAEYSMGKMTILADEAHMATEIDIAKSERELEEALRALKGEASSMSSQEATEAVERAMVRIRAAKLVQ